MHKEELKTAEGDGHVPFVLAVIGAEAAILGNFSSVSYSFTLQRFALYFGERSDDILESGRRYLNDLPRFLFLRNNCEHVTV